MVCKSFFISIVKVKLLLALFVMTDVVSDLHLSCCCKNRFSALRSMHFLDTSASSLHLRGATYISLLAYLTR